MEFELKFAPPLLLVRSEGGAECARLQEANGTGGGYASTTSPTPSQSQSPPPPQRTKIRVGGGRGEEQDSGVFKRDQGQEVQWGLVGMGAVSL